MIPINSQTPQKRELHPLGYLWVHSIFYTIQGEGPHAGVPAVFVRLAGCNLQCPGCDTEYTKFTALLDVHHILQAADRACKPTRENFDRDGGWKKPPLVVITGGEPFRQNIVPLVRRLLAYDVPVQVETNGTLWDAAFPLEADIVCSPKAGKIAIPAEAITALKYVVNAEAIDPLDGLPTSVLGMPAAPARPPEGFKGRIYVQPADEPKGGIEAHETAQAANARNLQAAVQSCKKFGYTLCVQMHKIIGVE